MEWPIFQMPFIGNRLLIATVALIHVTISHGLAVGGSFFVVSLHYKSLREKNERLNELAYRILRIFFIVTTSVGALTGVGIWLTTATVSPATIGSLLHVFFWAWFTEWLVFFAEVVLIMFYYLTWGKYGSEKGFKIGVIYVAMSWLTMMLITGILGAMLTPGKWIATKSFWDGFFNPSYLPQLLSRTTIAALLSIGFGLFFMRFFKSFRDQWPIVWKWAGKSLLIIAPLFLFGILNYYHTLPQQIEHLIATALMTTKYASWAHFSKISFVIIVILMMVFGAIFLIKKKDYGFLSFVPIFLLIFAFGNFERVREFIRKPYTIHRYLYSNAIRESEAPFLNKIGVSQFTGWAERSAKETDPVLRNGEKIFKLECSICHTYRGINGITKKTNILKDKDIIENFLKTYKRSHPYMPPFTGTDEERSALAAYLDKLVNKNTDTPQIKQAEVNK
jgi:mono/diheme cytochrome c family protein